jgi:pSer/pThr/pTyr-binding forkhead associated (FHA) protein
MTTVPLPNRERPPTIIFEVDDGELTLPRAEVLIIGRRTDSPDPQPHIDLSPFGAEEKGVSRRHIQLTVTNDAVYVADLGSTNGTWLNGQRLSATTDQQLRHGDELHLGDLRIKVRFS